MALKRGIAALALSCALLLTGCSSLLESPYAVVEPHTERPATAEDSSAVQAGTYSELVNTVLFFVSQGTEKGLIQLTDDYDGDVEEDLNRASAISACIATSAANTASPTASASVTPSTPAPGHPKPPPAPGRASTAAGGFISKKISENSKIC